MHNLQEHCFKYDGWHRVKNDEAIDVWTPDGMVLTEQENKKLDKWLVARGQLKGYSHPMYFLLRVFAHNGTYLHFLTSNKDIFFPKDEAPIT